MNPFRIVILLILGYILYRLLKSPSKKKTTQESAPKGLSDDVLVEDPHCHTYVPQKQAISLQQGESTLYFCSTECRDKFLNKEDKGEQT